MVYKTIHLFAGVGGGILADILLGHVPIAACELEKFPIRTMLMRQLDGFLPPFPIWNDIRSFSIRNQACRPASRTWRRFNDQLIVAGGFPCQNISSAGDGSGIDGSKSSLWYEMRRVIGELRPRLIFVENSPILTSRGLDRVCGHLAEMGYSARWGIVSAYDLGAPHLRKRIWLVGYPSRQSGKWGTRSVFGSKREIDSEGFADGFGAIRLEFASEGGRIRPKSFTTKPASREELIADANESISRQGSGWQSWRKQYCSGGQTELADLCNTNCQRQSAFTVDAKAPWVPRDPSNTESPGCQGDMPVRGKEEITKPCNGCTMANTESICCRTGSCKAGEKQNRDQSSNSGCYDANTNCKRCQEHHTSAQPTGTLKPCWASVEGWGNTWWSTEPGLGRVVDGCPNRLDRIRGLGNMQVPVVAAAAFKILTRDLLM